MGEWKLELEIILIMELGIKWKSRQHNGIRNWIRNYFWNGNYCTFTFIFWQVTDFESLIVTSIGTWNGEGWPYLITIKVAKRNEKKSKRNYNLDPLLIYNFELFPQLSCSCFVLNFLFENCWQFSCNWIEKLGSSNLNQLT